MIEKRFRYVDCQQNGEREGLLENNVCPICCEEMKMAVKMTCDERHLFHKECIQLWLRKHRNCPLCKVDII